MGGFEDGFRRYEITKDEEQHRTHHLICIECGSIQEVAEDLLGSMKRKFTGKTSFRGLITE